MTKNNYIMRKPYVSPTVSFEGIEDDALLWAKSAFTGGGGTGLEGEGEQEPDLEGGSSKEAPYDFVFQYD